jgi:hypothetical protein
MYNSEMRKLNLFPLLALILINGSSCNPMGTEKLKVEFKNPAAFKDLSVNVASISVINHQLVISGSSLQTIKKVTLKNHKQVEVFDVESASDNQLIANSQKFMSLLVGNVFDLILSDAYGSATFQVSFTLNDGAVTASKLHSMGATAGQVLKYNGTTWIPSSIIEGQNYLGTWNATTNVPDLSNASSNSGDYYVVDTAGTFNTVAFSIGDWIISDGYNWQKIGYSKTTVASFQGRKGIVTLTDTDYISLRNTTTLKVTGSKLSDIADIDLTTLADGQVLKWNAGTSAWIPSNVLSAASGIALTDLSATAPLTYNSTTGVFALSAATTAAAGSLSGADKTKLDGLTALPLGDGLVERFSGVLGMKTCATGEMLIWNAITGWTCTTTIILNGTSAQTMGMIRNSTANSAGNNLSVEASGATSAASDKNGGSLLLRSGISTGTGSSSIMFQTADATASGSADNNPTTKMTILGNGNVGIGTTTPSFPLHVTGTNTVSAGVQSLGGGTSAKVQLMLGTSNISGNLNVGAMLFADRTDAVTSGDTDFIIKTSAGLTMNSNLIVKSTGNVGIGTTAPNAALDIVSNVSDGLPALTIRDNESVANLSALAPLSSATSFSWNLSNSYGESVLINRTTATGSTRGFTFAQQTGTGAFSYPLRIEGTTGNIGIGTIIPTAKLSVVPNSLSSGATTLTAINAATTFTTSASTTLNVGDYLIPTTTTGQARRVTVGGTGTSFTVSSAFTAGVTAETYTVYPAAMNINSGKLFVQGSTGYVGIGTTVPAQNLSVNGSGYISTSFGVGVVADTAFGTLRVNSSTTSSALYVAQVSTGNAAIFTGGNVGIGITNPGYKLDVQGGDINASGNVRANTVALTSDYRWKRNINPLKKSLEKILQLTGVSYDWAIHDYPEKNFSPDHQIGVIAQNVKAVFPELVLKDKDGFFSVNYPGLIAPLIEATKEQQKQIETNLAMFKIMQGEIEAIKLELIENKREIAELKKENENLKKDNLSIKLRLLKIEKALMKNK